MKFKYSVAPNYHTPVDTKQIMSDLTIALLFVSVASIILQYYLYGMSGATRAISIMAIAVVTCYIVDYIFWKVKKVNKDKLKSKIEQNVPIITGLILALTLPLGNLDSLALLYVTFIAAIIAELFGKLIYGGFGYNIFNPAAVGRAFALLAFGKYLVIPEIDGLSGATPLTAVNSEEGIGALSESFADYSSLLFGTHQGSLGETMAIVIVLAGAWLIYRKVIDWTIPTTAIVTMAILATTASAFQGFSIDFIIVNILGGGLIFGAVFMLTDPVTNPLNRQGKIIYAMIFTLLTFLIRTKASLPEGVVFALLIVNMLVPMIDRFTANLTNTDINKKVMSITATLIVSVAITILFQFV